MTQKKMEKKLTFSTKSEEQEVNLVIMGVFWGILWYSWVNVWTGDGVPTEFTKVVFIENKSLLSYPLGIGKLAEVMKTNLG
jgi:hypothetical protein